MTSARRLASRGTLPTYLGTSAGRQGDSPVDLPDLLPWGPTEEDNLGERRGHLEMGRILRPPHSPRGLPLPNSSQPQLANRRPDSPLTRLGDNFWAFRFSSFPRTPAIEINHGERRIPLRVTDQKYLPTNRTSPNGRHAVPNDVPGTGTHPCHRMFRRFHSGALAVRTGCRQGLRR